MPISKDEKTGIFVLALEVYEAADGHRWRYRSANGQITQASHEAFSSPAACRKNFERFLEDMKRATEVNYVRVEK